MKISQSWLPESVKALRGYTPRDFGAAAVLLGKILNFNDGRHGRELKSKRKRGTMAIRIRQPAGGEGASKTTWAQRGRAQGHGA